MSFPYHRQRLARIILPRSHDHAAFLLMNAVGRFWLLTHGWKREYRLLTDRGWLVIDLAHPKRKLALEGDGERFHMDVVREVERDEALSAMGWHVRHYRYPQLRHEPGKVRRQVRRWYWRHLFK